MTAHPFPSTTSLGEWDLKAILKIRESREQQVLRTLNYSALLKAFVPGSSRDRQAAWWQRSKVEATRTASTSMYSELVLLTFWVYLLLHNSRLVNFGEILVEATLHPLRRQKLEVLSLGSGHWVPLPGGQVTGPEMSGPTPGTYSPRSTSARTWGLAQ